MKVNQHCSCAVRLRPLFRLFALAVALLAACTEKPASSASPAPSAGPRPSASNEAPTTNSASSGAPTAEPPTVPAPVAEQATEQAEAGRTGETIYQYFCFSCHAAGIAGAPKIGDYEAWAARLARGRKALLQTTINGIAPGMPAMGLCFDCSEAELAAAIDHMIEFD